MKCGSQVLGVKDVPCVLEESPGHERAGHRVGENAVR